MRWAAVTMVAGCLVTLLPVPVARATSPVKAAAPVRCEPARGSMAANQITDEPWTQKILNIKAAHAKATGRGVTVAVVDSGVTAANPQLAGRVLPGVDLTRTGQKDCIGHGTWVAGIIAAKRDISPFYGVAPDAKILPVKFAAQAQNIDSGLAAKGIDEAVRRGADVINVSTQSISDDPRLKRAVENALRKNIPVVAAAGNIDRQNGKPAQLMYPSGYKGVISVGAVDQSGAVTAFSNSQTPVTVIAPGKEIVTTAPDGNYSVMDGTSFATPFVTGVVALIKQRHPDLTPQQIENRIRATAEGSKGTGSGNGMINPYEAVTAVISTTAPLTPPASAGTGAAVEIVRPAEPDALTRNLALGIAGGALGLSAVVVAAGLLIPQGRRRGWRPGRVALPAGAASTGTARRVR